MIRVKHVDSVEQITDFSSANDHGVTLQKFQELGLPMTIPLGGVQGKSRKKMGIPGRSVFEEDFDTTAPDGDMENRWKFTGPWLAGMTLGKFKKWLDTTVKPRRVEFQEFLKKKIAAQNLQSVQAAALDAGEEVPTTIDAASITEEQVTDYLRNLRRNGDYQELYEIVGQFLDLAPLEPPNYSDVALTPLTRPNQLSYQSALDARQPVKMKANKNPYTNGGPPMTHPSAGISYLRTNMYLDNHPIYGPQATHAPVLGRVLRPRRQGVESQAKIGVAGFVADTPFGDSELNRNSVASKAMERFDPALKGGAKIFVQPLSSTVDAFGRIKTEFGDVANEECRLVAQELIGETKIFGEKPEKPAPRPSGAAAIRNQYTHRSFRMSSANNYGIDLS